jgi:hypothetical protein
MGGNFAHTSSYLQGRALSSPITFESTLVRPLHERCDASQLAGGGFNPAWCGEKDLDLLERYGLRRMLTDAPLSPALAEVHFDILFLWVDVATNTLIT